MIKARRDAGYSSQEEFALALGKTRSAVAKWEGDLVRPHRKTLEEISELTKKPLMWLESGVGEGAGGLMVVGRVAAGVWKEGTVAFVPFDMPYSPRSDYPAAAQRLWEVEGTSINRFAMEGEYLQGVSVSDTGLIPEDGDLVIVRRLEHGMAEYTAKLLVKNGKKWNLRPHSTDPAWQTDIEMKGDESTQIDVIDIIIGKVGLFSRHRRA